MSPPSSNRIGRFYWIEFTLLKRQFGTKSKTFVGGAVFPNARLSITL
jgi:hypothetical protein